VGDKSVGYACRRSVAVIISVRFADEVGHDGRLVLMEIKIGIVNAAREVSIDAQESVETIEQQMRTLRPLASVRVRMAFG
jgi:hypothetical protein